MSTPELYILGVTFKSGATVSTEVKSARFGQSELGNDRLSWTVPEDWTSQFLHLDLSEAVAITLTRRDSDGPA